MFNRVSRVSRVSKSEDYHLRLLSDTVRYFPRERNPFGYGNSKWFIAVSGGTDSFVLLDIAINIANASSGIHEGVDIVPFHMHLIPGLDITKALVRYVNRQWGVKLLTITHWRTIDYYISRGLFNPGIGLSIMQQELCTTHSYRNQHEVEQHLLHDHHADWIGYGYKNIDSQTRNRSLNSYVFGINKTYNTFSPLKLWTVSDVTQYMLDHRIPVIESYNGARVTSGNLTLSPVSMAYLKDNWPEDYSRVLEQWPLAITQADRFYKWKSNSNRVQAMQKTNLPILPVPIPEDLILDGVPLLEP